VSDSKTQQDYENYRRWAQDLAGEAGEITLRYFRKGIEVRQKADQSPVTQADTETEQLLRERIEERFPEHGLIGEEFGSSFKGQEQPEYTWIVDPIDGTKSFVHGVPLYTVLIALLHRGEPVVGIIHNPVTGETASAAAENGAWLNGTPARVSDTEHLEDAWLQVTDYVDFLRRQHSFAMEVMERAAAGRTWADGYGYLLVATGRSDCMIDPIMQPWDIAAVKPVITEAGGVFSDFEGNTRGVGRSAIAGTPSVHRELLELLGVSSGA
jgi:histidinol phosphatase-like enzyme (inositol monophosphatase family)